MFILRHDLGARNLPSLRIGLVAANRSRHVADHNLNDSEIHTDVRAYQGLRSEMVGDVEIMFLRSIYTPINTLVRPIAHTQWLLGLWITRLCGEPTDLAQISDSAQEELNMPVCCTGLVLWNLMPT